MASKISAGFKLGEGESILHEVEGEVFAVSADPISQLLGLVVKLIHFVTGTKVRSCYIITNKRVIDYEKRVKFWFFHTGEFVSYILPSSIKEVGYSKSPSFLGLFFPNYYFYLVRHLTTVKLQIKISTTETEMRAITDSIYNIVSK